MIIRASEETDLARILQIEKSVFPNSAWTRAMISDELTLNVDRKTWVIDSNKELVGYCMLRYGPNEVHLVNMAVDPSLQKMGIGKKLLIHFLDNIPTPRGILIIAETFLIFIVVLALEVIKKYSYR